MTYEDLQRMNEGKRAWDSIKKLEAQIENLKTCKRVQIYQCDPQKIENKERVFNINTGDDFYDESLLFIERYEKHLSDKLEGLKKEFENI